MNPMGVWAVVIKDIYSDGVPSENVVRIAAPSAEMAESAAKKIHPAPDCEHMRNVDVHHVLWLEAVVTLG